MIPSSCTTHQNVLQNLLPFSSSDNYSRKVNIISFFELFYQSTVNEILIFMLIKELHNFPNRFKWKVLAAD